MTLKDCYDKMGSDYEGVLARMSGSEKMVRKFALKFIGDPTEPALVKSFEEENYEEAFRMVHTLKGVCMNLGFDVLYRSSCELTEALRNHVADNSRELLRRVVEDYEMTVGLLKQLDAE